MSREIKFRVWNGNRMDDNKEALRVLYNLSTGSTLTPSHHPIMQFTGLKDKNGTDIYEGDIVNKKLKEGRKWSTGYFEYGTGNMVKTGDYYMETTSVVSFQNGCFGHLHSNEVFHAPFNDDFEHEVLGNIYEHPELIQKEKA